MPSRQFRILVVDDDPAMVGAITALVGTEGHQVITAYDGLTAVKRFREEHPDLVLLDLAMPGPDGFSVAGQMRAIGPAPIMVVSGESGEAAKVRGGGEEAGVTGHASHKAGRRIVHHAAQRLGHARLFFGGRDAGAPV